MIRKKYLAIFALIVVLLVGGILASPYLDWYMIPQKCSDRTLTLVESDGTGLTYDDQYLWFDYDGDNMILYYRPEAANITKICWIDLDENYCECALSDFKTDDTMAGSFIVYTDEPVELDLDGDGTTEPVRFIARTDNNSCKTFYGNYHCLGEENIPLEIVVDRTFADVLSYGQPYNGEMRMRSSYGLDETDALEDGCINYISYNDSEAGLMMFTCVSGEEHMVCSYMQESNVLNKQHLRALSALGILLLCSIVLIVALHLGRNALKKRQYR